MSATHVSIYGEVQGVGFRAWANSQASKDNLSGWVRKASDGSIEVFIQGEEEGISNFLSYCWDGPEMAFVDDVLTHEGSTDLPIAGFRVI
ncbi:MAG TPA: acylphosphatase [Gammaproteobacteria bacterium]|nr:acylphosphatase [Gammaproteobacteria bacterium]